VAVVSMDYSKDTVKRRCLLTLPSMSGSVKRHCHSLMLNKIEILSLPDHVPNWLCSRSHYRPSGANVRGNLDAGIVQGAVLGSYPLLWWLQTCTL